jgi:hypothetical protein
MRKLWRKYLQLLDDDLTTRIFDNIKNLLVCALLFAAGSNALHSDHHLFMGLFGSSLTGWGLIGLSALLMLLNISDGLRRLAKLPNHWVLQSPCSCCIWSWPCGWWRSSGASGPSS